MRLKLKSLVTFSTCLGLVVLAGYIYRESNGEEDEYNAMAAEVFGDTDVHVHVPGHAGYKRSKHQQDPKYDQKKQRMQEIIEEQIVGNLMNNVVRRPGKVSKEKQDKKVEEPARKVRKVFPEPISLVPQQGFAAGKPAPPKDPPPRVPQPPVPQHPAQPPGNAHGQPRPPQQQHNAEEINKARLEAAKQKQLLEQMKQEQSQQAAAQTKQEVKQAGNAGKQTGTDKVINLSVVCCGDRTNETLVMLKTATILTRQAMHFHIFAEDELHAGLAQGLNSWPTVYRRKFAFNLHPISFPPGEDPEKWKKVFKTCATQRLFLPDLLPDVDSLLYIDTDILFIRPVDEIYSFFKQFNSTQMAALTPEHEVKNIGWYNRFARHPYYGETGVNSGVMLMNLTRMRRFGWTQKIVPIYHEYKLKITWGDQDLINILFHDYPQGLFSYPCEWNYRPDHCMYSNNCHRTNEHGIAVIHGNRGVYHNEKQLAFRAIYESFRDYIFGSNLEKGLIQPLIDHLNQPHMEKNYCAKAVLTPVTSTLKKYVDQVIPIRAPVL